MNLNRTLAEIISLHRASAESAGTTSLHSICFPCFHATVCIPYDRVTSPSPLPGITLKSMCHPLVAAVDVVGDEPKLGQVFSNLLSNAIKFTPSGGTVALNIKLAKRSIGAKVADVRNARMRSPTIAHRMSLL